MIISESIFKDRVPIGRIFSDTQTGLFAFSPTKGQSLLPDREWRDVDELKRAIYEAYRQGKPLA